MAVVTAGASPATDPRLRGPVAARTTGPTAADRSPATVQPGPTVRSWPLLVLAAPAAAEVWSGWAGIAQKTGFGLVSPRPGIWPSLHLNTAITLPVGVEAYAAYALRAWLARDRAISARTRRFAKWSAICSFALGMAGQVACHLLAQAGMARTPWPVTTSCRACRSWAWGPRWRTCCGPTPRPPIRRTAGPDHQASCDPCPGPWRTWRDQAADDRWLTRTGSQGRTRTVPARTRPRPRHHETWPAARAATDGSGPRDHPKTGRNREASITPGAAQQRAQGLQRGPERPGAHG
jgi:hypothetical protein